MSIQLEQRIDLQRIAPTKWRLIGYVGRAVFFYAEAGNEEGSFTCNNEFSQEQLGQWRAIDTQRRLIVGFGGKAVVAPKADGKPGEFQATFDGVKLAL